MMKKIISHLIILTAFVFMGCDNGNAQQKANQIKKNRPKTVQKRVQKNSTQELIAPDFTLADLDGNWVSLSELKGKVVLLNLWPLSPRDSSFYQIN
jgi:cytochrome oxidase Cu insertion factor (SCO1/SenC/PrrC family)